MCLHQAACCSPQKRGELLEDFPANLQRGRCGSGTKRSCVVCCRAKAVLIGRSLDRLLSRTLKPALVYIYMHLCVCIYI